MAGIILTRGVKSATFEAGERVLCFEPDPTKVKVLYDAKILDTDWTRNAAGKRVPEYLVHFNGWNRSWDRWAPEDFVMKHNEENLEFQWRLQMEAEENSFKGKKKKKKLADFIDDARKRHQMSDSISGDGESEDSSLTEGHSVEEVMLEPEDDDVEEISVQISIPDTLKTKLEDDCYAINCQDKLLKIPCRPTALTVMEDYLQYFGDRYPVLELLTGVITTETLEPPPLPNQNFQVCREFLDGIRVLFDFLLLNNLLYEAEKEQYHLFIAKRISVTVTNKKPSRVGITPPVPTWQAQENPPSTVKTGGSAEKEQQEREEIPSRRITRRFSAIHSRSEITPVEDDPPGRHTEELRRPGLRHSRRLASMSSLPSSPSCSPTGDQEVRPGGPSPPAARDVAKREDVLPPHATDKTPPHRNESSDSSNDASKDDGRPPVVVEKRKAMTFEHLKLLSDDATYDGQIPACKIYGVVHLLRLFVKLPEVIAKMNLPPKKQKPLLKHCELFLRYLSMTSLESGFFPAGMYVSTRQALKNS